MASHVSAMRPAAPPPPGPTIDRPGAIHAPHQAAPEHTDPLRPDPRPCGHQWKLYTVLNGIDRAEWERERRPPAFEQPDTEGATP